MKKLMLIAVAPALFLTACGDPPPESGYVVSKSYDDPDDYTTQEPIYGQRCEPRTRYYTTYVNGSSQTQMSTDIDCSTVIISYYTQRHHDGPHWYLKVRDDKDKKHVGNVEVTETDYHLFLTNTHWPDPR